MKKSKKKSAFLEGFASAFDLRGKKLQKRHNTEENIHASWHNVGVFWTRGLNRIREERQESDKSYRKLSTY